jgi:pyrroline-5-carboxylate reductase
MAKIGFIGTGIMGKPMAQNLQKAGHTLFFSEHFDKAPADLLGDNGIGLANPREVAQGKLNSSSSWCRTPRRLKTYCSALTALPQA